MFVVFLAVFERRALKICFDSVFQLGIEVLRSFIETRSMPKQNCSLVG